MACALYRRLRPRPRTPQKGEVGPRENEEAKTSSQ